MWPIARHFVHSYLCYQSHQTENLYLTIQLKVTLAEHLHPHQPRFNITIRTPTPETYIVTHKHAEGSYFLVK